MISDSTARKMGKKFLKEHGLKKYASMLDDPYTCLAPLFLLMVKGLRQGKGARAVFQAFGAAHEVRSMQRLPSTDGFQRG